MQIAGGSGYLLASRNLGRGAGGQPLFNLSLTGGGHRGAMLLPQSLLAISFGQLSRRLVCHFAYTLATDKHLGLQHAVARPELTLQVIANRPNHDFGIEPENHCHDLTRIERVRQSDFPRWNVTSELRQRGWRFSAAQQARTSEVSRRRRVSTPCRASGNHAV